MTRIGINKKYIDTHTFEDLRKLNLGTKVKRNFIITLEELIHHIPNEKIIIANIVPSNNKTNIIIEKILKITKNNQNKNWFITSNYKEILDNLLLVDNRKFKVGKFILEEYDWNFSFEFYIVNKIKTNENSILEKLYNNQIIFINNVDSYNEFNYIKEKFENINIISNHPNKILYKH